MGLQILSIFEANTEYNQCDKIQTGSELFNSTDIDLVMNNVFKLYFIKISWVFHTNYIISKKNKIKV